MTRKGTKQAMLKLWAEPSGERRLSVYDRWGQLVSRAQGAGGGKGPGAGAVHEEPTVYAQTDGAGSPISQAECVWAEPGRRPTTKLTDAKPDGGGLGFILGRSDNLDGQLAGRTDPDGGGHNFVGDNGRLIQIILPNQNRMGRGDDNGSFRNASISPTACSDEPRMLWRVVSIKAEGKGGNALLWRVYWHDPSGNIAQIDSDSGKIDCARDKNLRLPRARPDPALQAKGCPKRGRRAKKRAIAFSASISRGSGAATKTTNWFNAPELWGRTTPQA